MIKLMVIDDERGICDFVADFFKRRNHSIVKVTDPRRAIELIEKERPRIILLDIFMPQMNGLDLLAEIRQVDKEVKIIMVTIASDRATRERAFNLGANDFVRKPFTAEYLESVVIAKVRELVVPD